MNINDTDKKGVDGSSTFSFFGSVLKAVACTPNLNESEDEYEEGVIVPARRIREMMKECQEASLNDEQVREVMRLLDRIFETKKVDQEERDERVREILGRTDLDSNFVL